MIKVLFEDNHTIAVVKPPGVPVMPDKSGDISMLDLVKEYIKEKYNKPGEVFLGLVHRLDRSTGGVMVFAKTSKGASRLSASIREKTFQKTYLAVVDGIMQNHSGTMKDFLRKDTKTNMSEIVPYGTPGSKEAILEYSVLKETEKFSLIKVNLLTGRHHQIRVQFAKRGHILYGDIKYGSPVKANLGLWACELSFLKPVGGEKVTVSFEPDYLTEPWRRFS